MSGVQNTALVAARYAPLMDTPECHASNVPMILGVTGTLYSVAMVTILLRVYVRTAMLSFFGADDWAMLGAALMTTGVFISFVGECMHGSGRHYQCTPPSETEMMMQYQFYHNIWNVFGLVLIKISIALLLIRLAPVKAWKWFLGGCIVFLVCFALACAGTLIFSCLPVSAAWDVKALATATCFSRDTFADIGLMNSIINIFTDFTFALLPIPIIYKLQINVRTKITLGFILSLGLIACAAGIVKANLQVTFFENPDRYWDDAFNVWAMGELCLGIIAASLPSLRPLFNTFFNVARNTFGLSSGRTNTNPLGYRKQPNSRDVEDSILEDSTEFKDMSMRTGTSSKNDIEVTRHVEIDTVPIRTDEAAMYEDRQWQRWT